MEAFADNYIVLAFSFEFLQLENQSYLKHMILRNLRPAGTARRAIPHGKLFSLVSCPNYF
jgi:very-long-chain enoyl-CoA reductase